MLEYNGIEIFPSKGQIRMINRMDFKTLDESSYMPLFKIHTAFSWHLK